MNIKLLTETGSILWEEIDVKKIIFSEDKNNSLDVFFINSKGVMGFPFKRDSALVEYIFATDTFMFHIKSPTLDIGSDFEQLAEDMQHQFDRSFENLVEKESIPLDDDILEKEDQKDLRNGG